MKRSSKKHDYMRVLSFMLSLVMTLSLTAFMPMSSYAEDASGTCGDDLLWNFNEETGTLTITGTGAMNDFGIPDGNSDNCPWRALKERITALVLPDELTTIGEFAFYGCSELVTVDIPEKVTAIGDYAFTYCTSLTGLKLSENVSDIGHTFISGCTALTEVEINEGNEYYYTDGAGIYTEGGTILLAYAPGNKNTKYTVQDGVKRIREGCFAGAKNLKNVDLPESLEVIVNYAFEASGIESITIPGGARLDMYPFLHCDSLKEITLSEGFGKFASEFLYLCPNVTKITFLDSETEIIKSLGHEWPEGLTFYGYVGSTAQAHAEEYGVSFVAINKCKTYSSASIRTGAPIGLRFTSTFSAADWSEIAEFGTAIYVAGNTDTILYIPARVDISGNIINISALQPGEDVTYTGVLSNIKKVNFIRDFTAVTYYKTINGNCVLNGKGCTKNASDVAYAALNDPYISYTDAIRDFIAMYAE